MIKKRIFITGGSGFLGWHLAYLLSKKYEVWACYFSHPINMNGAKTIRTDIADEKEVGETIKEIKPDAVIHAAAMTDVDRCEEKREEAFRVNITGTENVLRASSGIGASVIYTSTDLVFGEDKSMYSEEDIPSPMNYYGWTKLEGEKKVASYDPAVTLRMALMYGSDTAIKGSFLQWLKRGLESGEGVRLYTDQYRTPLYIDDAVTAIEAILYGRGRKPLYHIGGPQKIDRYSFGCMYAEVFDHNPELLIPVKMDDVPSKARRSHDCSLSIERARKDLGFNPLNVREGLSSLKKSLLD